MASSGLDRRLPEDVGQGLGAARDGRGERRCTGPLDGRPGVRRFEPVTVSPTAGRGPDRPP